MDKTAGGLLPRVAAAQATLDHFKGRPFVWGSCDCATLAAYVVRQLGGQPPLRRFGTYRTALGAKKALLSKGFNSLAQALDGSGLKRIAPAYALPGDILGLPGPGGDVSLVVLLGNGRAIGFHDEHPGGVLLAPTPDQIIAAWCSI